MTKQMQKLIQRSKKEISSTYKDLSIQFSLDGFSFCIKDVPSKEILLVTEYVFDTKIATPHLLLEKVTQIFETDKELQSDFKSVTAIHKNELVTQVPQELFDENHLKSYLNYNIKTLPSDFIAFDNLQTIGAKNVYIPYVNINNFLFQNFGEFTYKHHSTVLIEQLVTDCSYLTNEDFIFVNVGYNSMDILVFKNGTFSLYNSFFFTSKEDFLYYILFTVEQLELDLQKLELFFTGTIGSDFETYKITYDYIKNVSFLIPKHDFFEKSEHFFPHSNYTIVS